MKIYTLSNKMRVVCENQPYYNSISVGFWVKAGCFAENEKTNGISHFIEHMLFKGTKKRSSREIANCIDALGGQLNAFTAKECTCFYVNILKEHYGVAIDLLCDMITSSRIDEKDIKLEQGVVCEEISMVEDTPDDVAHENLAKAYYGEHPLGQTILGTQETVRSFDRDAIKEYMSKTYIPQNIVVSVCGNFDENAVINMLEEKLADFCSDKPCPELAKEKTNVKKEVVILQKDIEQINLCLGFSAVGQLHKDYYAQTMVANIFGGGMSSRLFQRIREQNGMTYAIYAFNSAAVNSGMFSIYAGMNPSQAERVYSLILEEINKIKMGITDNELFEAKQQLKGGFLLGLESANAKMNRNGKELLLKNRILDVSEIILNIDSVTKDDIMRVVENIFCIDKMCVSLVGNYEASSIKNILCK